MNANLKTKTTIMPVWSSTGQCLTDMYKGFDPKPHKIKTNRKKEPVWSSETGWPKDRVTATRRARTPVTTRQINRTVGYIEPAKQTAADFGLKVLIKYNEA